MLPISRRARFGGRLEELSGSAMKMARIPDLANYDLCSGLTAEPGQRGTEGNEGLLVYGGQLSTKCPSTAHEVAAQRFQPVRCRGPRSPAGSRL